MTEHFLKILAQLRKFFRPSSIHGVCKIHHGLPLAGCMLLSCCIEIAHQMIPVMHGITAGDANSHTILSLRLCLLPPELPFAAMHS